MRKVIVAMPQDNPSKEAIAAMKSLSREDWQILHAALTHARSSNAPLERKLHLILWHHKSE